MNENIVRLDQFRIKSANGADAPEALSPDTLSSRGDTRAVVPLEPLATERRAIPPPPPTFGPSMSTATSRNTSPAFKSLPSADDNEKRLAFAHLERFQFELRKQIERHEKETDGGARTIPGFRALQNTLDGIMEILRK